MDSVTTAAGFTTSLPETREELLARAAMWDHPSQRVDTRKAQGERAVLASADPLLEVETEEDRLSAREKALRAAEPVLRGRIEDPAAARKLLLAGNATATLVSARTGTRFTFRVRQPKEGAPHFVSLLRGPSNEDDYAFLGTVFPDGTYRHGRRSAVSPEAPSARAFDWFWRALSSGRIPAEVELWHEGRCCRCGRKLTVPESVASGLGPDCAGRV